MRCVLSMLALAVAAAAQAQSGSSWSDLASKREVLASFHQEFEVNQITLTAKGKRTMKRLVTLDAAPGMWREKTASGSSTRIRIFDGADLLSMDEDGDEYVRNKHASAKHSDPPLPSPYRLDDPDWSKASEIEHRPCTSAAKAHPCVVLEAPLKKWRRSANGDETAMLGGTARILIDTETGLIMSSHTAQTIKTARGGYQTETSYTLKRLGYGGAPDAALFKLPASGEWKEVKELTPWDAPKIRKKLAGQPAPELILTDMEGKAISLADFKGKTILIDFWTTWCGPCRADAPAIDKLYTRYGEKDLQVIGISVSENREVVEKFLGEHPHSYPIALTTENDMPRPYQIHVFPTYIIVARDGTVVSATQGTQGFGELKKLLKKAGLESEE